MPTNFFDDDEAFDLPDGGDLGSSTPEPAPASNKPSRLPTRPPSGSTGLTRPALDSRSDDKSEAKRGIKRPNLADLDLSADEPEVAPKPAPAPVAPPQRPTPSPKVEVPRPAPVTQPKPAPAPTPTPQPAPVAQVQTPVVSSGSSEHYPNEEIENPFANDGDSIAEDQGSFMDEVDPKELSPQIDPKDEERQEREERTKKVKSLIKRRAKPTDPVSRVKRTKKKGKKGRKAAESEGDEPQFTRFAGSRKRVLYSMVLAGILILVLSALGLKSVLFPPQIPSPDVVTSTVAEGLGITKFPEEEGNAHVISFMREYLTVDPKTIDEKPKRLEAFTPEALAAVMTNTGDVDTKVAITEGPFISGVESIDDNRAMYTVAAERNDEGWVYLEVPVYYDSDNNGFSVYQMPSFVAKPQTAGMPTLDPPFEVDSELAEEIKADQTAFFKAWGASDPENLSRYLVNDASIEARTGLQGSMEFVSLDELNVEAAPGDADPAAMPSRRATATVTWRDAETESLTFHQSYDLKLYQQPDKRWYVEDITGSTNATVAQ